MLGLCWQLETVRAGAERREWCFTLQEVNISTGVIHQNWWHVGGTHQWAHRGRTGNHCQSMCLSSHAHSHKVQMQTIHVNSTNCYVLCMNLMQWGHGVFVPWLPREWESWQWQLEILCPFTQSDKKKDHLVTAANKLVQNVHKRPWGRWCHKVGYGQAVSCSMHGGFICSCKPACVMILSMQVLPVGILTRPVWVFLWLEKKTNVDISVREPDKI